MGLTHEFDDTTETTLNIKSVTTAPLARPSMPGRGDPYQTPFAPYWAGPGQNSSDLCSLTDTSPAWDVEDAEGQTQTPTSFGGEYSYPAQQTTSQQHILDIKAQQQQHNVNTFPGFSNIQDWQMNQSPDTSRGIDPDGYNFTRDVSSVVPTSTIFAENSSPPQPAFPPAVADFVRNATELQREQLRRRLDFETKLRKALQDEQAGLGEMEDADEGNTPTDPADDDYQPAEVIEKRSRRNKRTKSKSKPIPFRQQPHPCLNCKKTFADPTKLRKHGYTHRPKEQRCSEPGCTMEFHTKKDLRRHCDTKHGTPTLYICTFDRCERKGRKFSRKDNAKQHVIQVHSCPPEQAESNVAELPASIDDIEMMDAVRDPSTLAAPQTITTFNNTSMAPTLLRESSQRSLHNNALRSNTGISGNNFGANPYESERFLFNWAVDIPESDSEVGNSVEPETHIDPNLMGTQSQLQLMERSGGAYLGDSVQQQPQSVQQMLRTQTTPTTTIPPNTFPSSGFR